MGPSPPPESDGACAGAGTPAVSMSGERPSQRSTGSCPEATRRRPSGVSANDSGIVSHVPFAMPKLALGLRFAIGPHRLPVLLAVHLAKPPGSDGIHNHFHLLLEAQVLGRCLVLKAHDGVLRQVQKLVH